MEYETGFADPKETKSIDCFEAIGKYEDDKHIIFIRPYIGVVKDKYELIVQFSCLVKGMDTEMPESIRDLPHAANVFLKDCMKLVGKAYVIDLIGQDPEQIFMWNPEGPINMVPVQKIRSGKKDD